MAPVLFISIMSAFTETLEVEWKNARIMVCMVQSAIGEQLMNGEGKLRGHLPKDYMSHSLTAAKILQCLYVGDGTFIFASRADLTKGLDLIYTHFGKFGLEMHIGRGNSPSKMECVFFPSPGFFDSCLPSLPATNDAAMNNVIGDKSNDGLSLAERIDENNTRTQWE